ncbi:hypothetical protein [Streptacidiphilus monticola]|uniref:Uncharacterized protein n=1 Tax=Streptacidiphilus monticola TaxID=2161674 RepID=A0ABW1G288_9ACTN
MEYRQDGWKPDPGGWRSTAEAFPGPFAVVAEPGFTAESAFVVEAGVESSDHEPWAITLRYADAAKRRLYAVRTVRSPDGMASRVRDVEELPSHLAQFDWVGGSDRAPTEAELDAWMDAVAALERRAARLTPTQVSLLVDGVPVPGRRLALDGLAGVELPDWHGQQVFVVGQETALDGIALRTGSVAEDLRVTFPRN